MICEMDWLESCCKSFAVSGKKGIGSLERTERKGMRCWSGLLIWLLWSRAMLFSLLRTPKTWVGNHIRTLNFISYFMTTKCFVCLISSCMSPICTCISLIWFRISRNSCRIRLPPCKAGRFSQRPSSRERSACDLAITSKSGSAGGAAIMSHNAPLMVMLRHPRMMDIWGACGVERRE